MIKLLFLSFILISCSAYRSGSGPKEGKKNYAYIDASGRVIYARESKVINKTKLVSRVQLLSSTSSLSKPLEKSIMVSQMGSVKEGGKRVMVMRPLASEFTVWLEGKKYESHMKLDTKSRSMVLQLSSPDAKWNGQQSVKVPKGKQFCFFSQIPDCLYHNSFLARAKDHKGAGLPFFVVWESFPFIQEQITGVGSKLFSPAVLKYDGVHKSFLKYSVEVDGQTVLYHFSKDLELVRMFWIAQGISIIPPNEDVTSEE